MKLKKILTLAILLVIGTHVNAQWKKKQSQ